MGETQDQRYSYINLLTLFCPYRYGTMLMMVPTRVLSVVINWVDSV